MIKRQRHHAVGSGAHDTAVRVETNSATAIGERSLNKRIEGAKFSFYSVGLGACGQVNTNDQFVSDTL